MVANFASPDVLGLKLPEAFTTGCAGQDFWELESKDISGPIFRTSGLEVASVRLYISGSQSWVFRHSWTTAPGSFPHELCWSEFLGVVVQGHLGTSKVGNHFFRSNSDHPSLLVMVGTSRME